MAPIHSTVKQLIDDNSKNDFLQASNILLKFANNIIRNPSEGKYRKIRLSNPTVESKLLPVSGALECLFEMGFTEDGEFLSLPQGDSMVTLKQIRDELDAAVRLVQMSVSGPSSGVRQTSTPGQAQSSIRQPSTPSQVSSGVSQPSVTQHQATRPPPNPRVPQSERTFMQKLESNLAHVLQYEDPRLIQKALQVIPLPQLNKEAEDKLQSLRNSGSADGVSFEDLLLLQLLSWFKYSFFKWTDAPKCDICQGDTRSVGMADPLPDEKLWQASRVENYKCDRCQKYVRFPRYNHPGKLLDTRNGRCGEWANCFTLCCRAVGFEARFVLDWTDHVWTEVYSKSQKRWLHCDPCENVCDKPLLYEVGWGKKLTYVIAFSKDEVQDVSMRYTANCKGMLQRRNEVRESWLVNVCHRLWQEMISMASPQRRQEMTERLVVELVELITEKSSDSQQLGGRTTGSLAWRVARGETGAKAAKAFESYSFVPTAEELKQKLLHVRYSCAKDVYVRPSACNQQSAGFSSRLFKMEDIIRKEEHDWKMVYLARKEGSASASIAWRFNLTGTSCKVSHIEIRNSNKTFENGQISWRLCSDNQCALLQGNDEMKTITDLEGETDVTLTADLIGGKGDVAWQHTQLFRQSLEDKDSWPFEVKVYLK